MSWIDCKVRNPTEVDEDASGRLFWRCQSGYTFCGCHDNARTDLVAWMPIPEFTPLPDPPEGYEFLQDYDSDLHPLAMQLDSLSSRWRNHWTKLRYIKNEIYAVPIKPPEPQYRPFANAEEFRPFRKRWWKHKDGKTLQPTTHYSDALHHGVAWKDRFQHLEFEDGTPFGLPVDS